MVRLSIIIPVLGKLGKLEDTLISVLENRPAHCEIVVVLNEPYNDPYELAGEVRFVDAAARPPLVDCLNLGIAASRGSIIHTLVCGGRSRPVGRTPCFRISSAATSPPSAPWVIDRADGAKTLSIGVGYRAGGAAWRLGYRRSIASSVPQLPDYFGPDLIAGFFRESAVEAVGGLDPAFSGHLAAVNLALSLGFADGRSAIEPRCRVLADRLDVSEGERLGSGRQAELLFWRWARRMGWRRACAGHAALVADECLQSIVRPTTLLRLFGRAWGSMTVPFRPRKGIESLRSGLPENAVIAGPHFMPSLSQKRPREVSKAS